MITYPIGTAAQVIEFSDDVLAHFEAHRQNRFWDREAGGQLFAMLEPARISIVVVTGPRPTDRRTRTSYVPDRKAEQAEILAHHERGLHFVGDWHTHPQSIPEPSKQDFDSLSDCFARSTHDLRGFLLVIVGRDPFPRGLHVTLLDDKGVYPLSPVSPSLPGES